MIICASPNKAFARTAKGTNVRKLTEELYQQDISDLYSSPSESNKTITIGLAGELKTSYEPAAVVEFLRQLLAASFPPAATFGEEDEFFAHGLDSIQTLAITTNLKRNLEGLTSRSIACISPRTIFRHPTLKDLSGLLATYLNGGIAPAEDSQTARAAAVDDKVARYVEYLPSRAVSQPRAASSISTNTIIAIIGSTGYVGAHLVATLLRDTVSEILESLILQSDKNLDAPQFFNIASEPQPWTLLLDILRESWPADGSEVVSLPEWVSKLRALMSSSAAPDVDRLPALRLMDFYELLGNGSDSMTYATEHTRAVCGVDLAPGGRTLLSSWLRCWDL